MNNIKHELADISQIRSVHTVDIDDNLIQRVSFEHENLGRLEVLRLQVTDASKLYEFYFNGLSEEARNLFPPYPLFSPPISSAKELADRIKDWREENDWAVFILWANENIIGVSLLKKWSTDCPTSGIAVHKDTRRNNLGVFLQTVVNQQAKIIGLKKVCVTVAPDNTASLNLHGKCGFKRTGNQVPHYGYLNGEKIIDRYDVELVLDFSS